MSVLNIAEFEDEDGETLSSSEDEPEEKEKEKRKTDSTELEPQKPKKKMKVLHDTSWHDLTDPNATTGVPYYVYKGAKHVLLFFRIDLLGLKQRMKLQV